MDATSSPATSFVSRMANAIQWIVFAFMSLLVLVLAADLGKLEVPGAPITYLFICIAVALIAAVIHLPIVFRRVPRKAKLAAYLAVLPILVLFGDYTGAMQAAYVRTPEGAKEAAESAASERRRAAVKTQEDARLKAQQDAAVQEEAAQKQADLEEQKPALCQTLVGQVVDGENVIEINNVSVETSYEPNETLTCSGDAITSRGNVKIEFGLVKTPQGKPLVSIRYP